MKVKSESEVAQSCPILSDPMDCSLPGSSVHVRFQAGILEWRAIAFSGGLLQLLCKSLIREGNKQLEFPGGIFKSYFNPKEKFNLSPSNS